MLEDFSNELRTACALTCLGVQVRTSKAEGSGERSQDHEGCAFSLLALLLSREYCSHSLVRIWLAGMLCSIFYVYTPPALLSPFSFCRKGIHCCLTLLKSCADAAPGAHTRMAEYLSYCNAGA